jgi:uncharacterized membrane protein YhaH (DUF805 family)
VNWYLAVLKNYVGFTGRARRQEYWMFTLISAIIYVVLEILLLATGSQIFQIIYYLYALAVLLPSLAVFVRRMHDVGRSGWWILLGLIPIIGAIILIVFAATAGQQGPNQYGPDPKQLGSGQYPSGGYPQEPGYPQHGYQAPPPQG